MWSSFTERGDTTWRLRAEAVAAEADRLAAPSAIASVDPISFPDGSLGIGTIRGRPTGLVLGAILAPALGALVFVCTGLYRGSEAVPNAGSGYLIVSLLCLAGLVCLWLHSRPLGANSILVVDRHGAYVAWQTELGLRPSQTTLSWQADRLLVEIEIRRHYNAEYYFVHLYRQRREGGMKRLVCRKLIDDLAKRCWDEFDLQVRLANIPV